MSTPYQQPRFAKPDDLLLSVDDPTMIESGINKSLHPLQAPLWIDGENVIFVDQSVRKAPGYQQICPPGGTSPVRGIKDVLSNTIPHVFFGDINNLYDIDGSRTNLILNSQSYSASSWNRTNWTITSTNNSAPDGTPTASLLTSTSSAAVQLFSSEPTNLITIVAGEIYTFSCYVKLGSGNFIYNIGYGTIDAAEAVNIVFDTLNGTIIQDNLIGTSQIIQQSIVNAGNGWWRLQVSGTIGGGETGVFVLLQTTQIAVGDSLLVWGMQLELGNQASTYIATGATKVTLGDFTLANTTATITGSGYKSEAWSMESWGNFGLASNAVDDIQVNKYDGAGFVRLAGSPPRAQIIMRSQVFLLAIGTSQNSDSSYNINGDDTVLGPSFFSFCDIDNIEQWLANDDQSQAGAQNIRDLDSGIIAASGLGGPIAVYSNNTMAVINYIGTPFWFGYSVALRGFGPVGKFAVVSRERQNYGFGRDGIWSTDGNSFTYIDPPDVRKYLQDNVNWAYAWKINGFLNERQSMIEFSFPSLASTEPDTTICFCYKNNRFTFKPYGRSAGLAKNTFGYPITVASNGNIYWNEFGVDADRQAMNSFIQSKPLHCNQRMYWKAVTSIIFNMKQIIGTGIKVYLGVQEVLTDPITWVTPQNLDMSSGPLYWDNADGVFLTVKITSTGLGDDWALAGFDILGTLNGLIQ